MKKPSSANSTGATTGYEAQLWRMADARQPTIGQVVDEAIVRTAPFGYPVNEGGMIPQVERCRADLEALWSWPQGVE